MLSRYLRHLSALVFVMSLAATSGAVVALAAPASAPQEKAAAAEQGAAEEAHSSSLMPTIAKLVNFAILVGALVYFLKTPVGTYLRTRSETVRRELVDAAALRSEAERQLSDVRSQLAALPAELESLRRHGEEELVHERARMKAATERTREQLLERTRHDIDFQFRQARRQLVEHTADVAMKLARRRLEQTITPDDQVRLIDQYTAEVRS